MKKLFLFFAGLTLFSMVFGQAPASFKYQAVARDGSGTILSSKSVSFRISIQQGSATGAIVYSERHYASTNEFGLVTLEIGKGTVDTGTMAAISWGTDSYFIKVEMDPNGGNTFQLMGSSQLLSVPYALHAKTVETGDKWGNQSVVSNATLTGNGTVATPLSIAQQGASVGQLLKWNGTTWIPAADETGPTYWTQDGTDLYYNSGKVGIGRIPGMDTRQFQSVTGDNQAVAATNNSATWPALFAQNFGSGIAAEFRNPIRIMDGTQGAGKVLTSNANGLASWQVPTGGGASPGGLTGHVQFNNGGAFGGDGAFFWDNTAKRLGLGTNAPNYSLTVHGGASTSEIQLINNTTGSTGVDGVKFGIQSGTPNAWLWNYENGELYFGTNNIKRMTILGNGNVGIGDPTPDASLSVQGSVKVGTNGLSINEIREVTGTTGATLHYVSFAYPAGYTMANTRVLSLEVNYNSTSWMGLGATNNDATNVAVFYNLSTAAIFIYYPDLSFFKNKPFRMVLMKVE